jgi:predicted transcriptional regulator
MVGRRGMGELESAVLRQLWQAGRPLTPSEVRDGLGAELAYTTVMTILGRLWEKGLAHRERRGRGYAYWPTLTEAELAAQRMRATLERTVDREKTLARFVDELSVKDERALRRILGRLRSER